ncbi:MAG: PEP-CTERM sorting domain-containing protein [Armatimonadetes bacterium]|nr:PEP-CTERM sorting domain-containing protein [Armatimonadota bacterium]
MRKWMLLSFGACLAGSAMAAPIVVDDFSSLSQTSSVVGLGFHSTWASGGTMLGGSRALQTSTFTSDVGLSSGIDCLAGPGVCALSNDFGNASSFWLGYLCTGASGGNGLFYSTSTNADLSSWGAMELDVVRADLAFSVTVIFVSEFSIGGWSKSFGPVASPTTITVASTDGAFGSYDSANVDQLIVQIDPVKNGDLTLDEIRLVPEPASLATLGLGALALMRRRKA